MRFELRSLRSEFGVEHFTTGLPRSKGRGWESCYVKNFYRTFGVEMRAYGQKLVQFCKHTHTRLL